jgi:tRNA threonylcarbamoyladenosine biosynthesis protein TsaE
VSVSVSDLVVSIASPQDAAAMIEVIHSAFGARPRVDPPSDADEETAETLAAKLRRGSGIFAQVEGRPAGVIVVLPVPDVAWHREVLPRFGSSGSTAARHRFDDGGGG